MPNPHRGEIAATLGGQSFRLCLTLGALAELEHAFGDTDMLALAERFQNGRLSARDALRIIGAGLRGAGHEIADEAVARLQGEGGATGFVDIVARLLTATFGSAQSAAPPRDLPAELPSPLQRGAEPQVTDGLPSPLRGGVGGGGNASNNDGNKSALASPAKTFPAPAEERASANPFPGQT
jgi:hypothetical protein